MRESEAPEQGVGSTGEQASKVLKETGGRACGVLGPRIQPGLSLGDVQGSRNLDGETFVAKDADDQLASMKPNGGNLPGVFDPIRPANTRRGSLRQRGWANREYRDDAANRCQATWDAGTLSFSARACNPPDRVLLSAP